ncbi:MAG: hypothetical protein LBE85_09665 [Candidatus Accumulibacter sp.]|nr:hypothetical protein [Accumulibacter sp.]
MLLVLIPIFMIGWALYAYGQARTTALNGARFAAWERTVWRDGDGDGDNARTTAAIEDLMIERFFARPGAAIQSSVAGATNADVPSFYSLHNGDKVVDIEKAPGDAQEGEAARPTLTLEESSEKTSTVATIYNRFSKAMGKVGAKGMPLEDKGMYEAEVSVKLNAVRHLKVFEDLNLTVTQRATVVADSWSAGGKEYEESVVEPLVPMGLVQEILDEFKPLTDVLDDAEEDFGAEVNPFREFVPGCVQGDIVPTDMLPSGSTQINKDTACK